MLVALRRSALALTVGFSLGCTAGPGRVSHGQYTSERYALAVIGSGAPESAGLMPTGWKLDNFYGSPVPDRPKEGENYQVEYRFDVNGDGQPDGKRTDLAFELRFDNTDDDGVIWLRVIPVPRELKSTRLSVLIDSYVESLAGGEYESVLLEAGRSVTQEKRYASRLISSQPCRLARLDCLLVTIELADVDQLRLDPKARTRMLSVLLARAPFAYKQWEYEFPTYLMVGYSNQPARFESGLPAFHDLLRRIVIDQHKGLALMPSTAAAPAPSAAPPTPAAPAQPEAAPAAPPAPEPSPTP